MFYSNAFGQDMQLEGAEYGDGSIMPVLNTPRLYANNNTGINPVRLIDRTTNDLLIDVYEEAAPIRITTAFAMCYAASFMTIAASIVHVLIWYGKDLYKQIKAASKQLDCEEEDVHNQLMKAYPDLPEWVFLAFLAFLTLLQVVVGVYTAFEMPIWAVFLCIGMTALFVLPIGIINAVTGFSIGLNVLSEFVIGLLLPGRTVPVMAFKSLSTNSMLQATALLADLKLGHYLHIPPIAMVGSQVTLYILMFAYIKRNRVAPWHCSWWHHQYHCHIPHA
jgi:OPT family oligopeptide transporter